MAYCEACENLREYAANFLMNGVTSTECSSLKKNTGLNPNLKVLHENCEDLNDINDCLIGALGESLSAYDICDLKDYVEKLMANMYTYNQALLCSECGQWNMLNDLRDLINAIGGGAYKRLKLHEDYEITFHNSWTTTGAKAEKPIEADTVVEVIETSDRNFFRIRSSTSAQTHLWHDDLRNIDLRHSYTILERPKSRLFSIKFKGNKYGDFDKWTVVDTTEGTTGNINAGPKRLRAAWEASCRYSRKVFDNTGVTLCISGIADGYNSQYHDEDAYPQSSPIYTHYMNYSVSFTAIK